MFTADCVDLDVVFNCIAVSSLVSVAAWASLWLLYQGLLSVAVC